jgi:hypothetical protein
MGLDEMMRLAQRHLGSHRWVLVDQQGATPGRQVCLQDDPVDPVIQI